MLENGDNAGNRYFLSFFHNVFNSIPFQGNQRNGIVKG